MTAFVRTALGLSAFAAFAAVQTSCELAAPSSMTDVDSPYYDQPCPLEQHIEFKTDLPADCRCATNQVFGAAIPMCQRPYEVNLDGIRIGEGPSLANLYNLEYNGGFLDESEGPEGTLYVAASYGGSTSRGGHILTVDVATGNRKIISGPDVESFSDDVPAEEWGYIGEGPEFESVLDVSRASDGSLIAFTRMQNDHRIFRVDPVTGNREVLWGMAINDPPPARCYEPSLNQPYQITDFGFALDDEDRVYVGVSNPITGRGIIRFSADFQSCEVVTLPGVKGGGVEISGFINGFTFHEGKLIASETMGKQYFSVNLQNGNRTLIVQGSGVAPPERWARWDADRGVWWLVGYNSAVTVDIFEPATGEYASIFGGGGVFDWMPLGAGGPININSLNYAPVWIRSNGNLLLGQDGMSIVEFEPHSGNSVIISL